MKQLIINAEYFLQCYGHCSGCFLTEIERNSKTLYANVIMPQIDFLSSKYKQTSIEHLIIGFGRGNLLNLDKSQLTELLSLLEHCENSFNYKKITFEISTSLIGKIDKQIENALFLLNKNKNIYFNVVVNSEITSQSFWKNLSQFYNNTISYRENWGWTDNTGDILVLNINPANLPNIDFLREFSKNYHSPLNISLFPFDKSPTVEQLKNLLDWSEQIWLSFSHKDLNIKNFLTALNSFDVNNSILDIKNYQEMTEKYYYFIDKNGKLTNGSLSIMGEVDKIRLLEKYDLKLDILSAYKAMQKQKACRDCDYKTECLVSGAYLNLMANKKMSPESDICLSGYQKLFHLAQV